MPKKTIFTEDPIQSCLPNNHKIVKVTTIKPLIKKKPKLKWIDIQIKQYLLYLVAFKFRFQTSALLSETVYKEMAKFIQNQRTAQNCVNMHDRMKQKYKSYQNIVNGLCTKLNIKRQQIQAEGLVIRDRRQKQIKRMLQFEVELPTKQKCLTSINQKQNYFEIVTQEHILSSNNKSKEKQYNLSVIEDSFTEKNKIESQNLCCQKEIWTLKLQ